MKRFRNEAPDLFEAFIKSVQYIVRLKTQQDIWEHLEKLILTYFPADWTAFVRLDPQGDISILQCTLPDEKGMQCFLNEDVRTLIAEVLDSGFLASRIIFEPFPSMTVFLPIVEQNKINMVMLIGHKTAEPLPNELLNIYLAISGLAGATFERLYNEIELKRHHAQLEDLVRERTNELASAKRQNELILNSVGEGICGMDLNGRITFVNPSAVRTLGWEPDELNGRSAHETFHHKRSDGNKYPVEECIAQSVLKKGTEECATDEEFIRKDGTRFPVEFVTTPIIEGGAVVGAVMVFRDITERRRTEQELARYNRELELFAYAASHDLQEPLRKIMVFGDRLRIHIGAELDEKGDGYLKRMESAARRMKTLITGILQFSRISRRDLDLKPIDLGKVARDVISDLEIAITETAARISLGALPVVRGDPLLLGQLFQNIISNSLKFRSTSEAPRISIECKFPSDGSAEILFRDNGIGFDEKYLEKMFKPFQRLHSISDYEGIGMGLAICQKITAQHGGEISAKSTPGDGATFIVKLPVC